MTELDGITGACLRLAAPWLEMKQEQVSRNARIHNFFAPVADYIDLWKQAMEKSFDGVNADIRLHEWTYGPSPTRECTLTIEGKASSTFKFTVNEKTQRLGLMIGTWDMIRRQVTPEEMKPFLKARFEKYFAK
jgi:hypothetical protein